MLGRTIAIPSHHEGMKSKVFSLMDHPSYFLFGVFFFNCIGLKPISLAQHYIHYWLEISHVHIVHMYRVLVYYVEIYNKKGFKMWIHKAQPL